MAGLSTVDNTAWGETGHNGVLQLKRNHKMFYSLSEEEMFDFHTEK
jgi:hypothetical protein